MIRMPLTEIRVSFNRGNSSSKISPGNLLINFPRALNPKQKLIVFNSAESSTSGGGGIDGNDFTQPCMVVNPYTASIRSVRASRMANVASNTWGVVRTCTQTEESKRFTFGLPEYLIHSKSENTSASFPSRYGVWFSINSHKTINPYSRRAPS